MKPKFVTKGLQRVRASTNFYVQELNAWVEAAIREQIELLKPQIGIVTTIGSDHCIPKP
jgi:UDP-N-acetylmuramyl pentapeptide synthase